MSDADGSAGSAAGGQAAEGGPAPDRRLLRDVILRDGSTLRLRSPEPDDAEAIREFFDRMSPDSRYLRFHGYGRTDTPARMYADADGDARVALLARHDDQVVAVAGYERLRDPDAAEVAFAVSDDFQGRGVGTRLLEQLAGYAAEHGVRRFDAEVLSRNRRMLGVFRSAGFETRREGLGDEVHMTLDLRPTDELAARIAERDHLASVASLRAVLAPAAVAVVGASNEEGSVGGAIFENVVRGGFRGVATPVNRGGPVVRSVRAVPRLSELAEVPELAVLAVPAAQVLGAVRDAADAGVKAVLVVASGFSESGEEGREREEALLEVVRSSGMRMIGPNSLGVLSNEPDVRLQATIAPLEAPPGAVALSSQSGALGLALLGHAAGRDLGIASFVSLGNRADVSTNDLLEYWEEDDAVAAITLYVESFGNPRRFSEISRRVSRRKPILAVRGDRGPRWEHDDASHTASALRSEAIADALLRQAGVLRCDRPEELFDAAQLLAQQPLPAGRQVAILTNSGGLGTLARDACDARGLLVPELAPATQERLRAAAPRGDRTANPVDMGIRAGPQEYAQGLRALLDDDAVDAVVASYVQLAGHDPEAVLEAIAAAGDERVPIVASVLGADGRPVRRPGSPVPNFRFPEASVVALAHAAERRDWLSRPLGQHPELADVDPDAARAELQDALAGEGSRWLDLETAERLVASHGIRYVRSEACTDVEEAVDAARVRAPIALKAQFEPPFHAADFDAVLLGLEGEEAVRAGWEELRRRVEAAGREWVGALVQPLLPAGADVLVGSVTDAELGPLVALGLGGRHAGLASDVAYRLATLTDVDADELIASSRGVSRQLAGFRGAPPLDHTALRDLVLRFARLLQTFPEVVEVDLNPVRVLQQGCAVLDLRVRVEQRPARPRVKTW